MANLNNISVQKIQKTKLEFKRYLFNKINWNNRLIGVKGARGTGKTTMLLQYLKENTIALPYKMYLSLDDLYFSSNKLVDYVTDFYQKGGKLLVLDEVHKYENWATEIKILYDRYDDLNIIFTGSSIIEISQQEADLSRRALMYELKGLSLREYILFEHNINYPTLSLKDILNPEFAIYDVFDTDFKPLKYLNEYYQQGYYPFYREDKKGYLQRIRQLTRQIVEFDMAELKGFDIRHAKKMLQLIYIVAQQVPFTPNISKLADKAKMSRNSVSNYLYFLESAKLLQLLYNKTHSITTLQKPEKIYLENTNLFYALSEQQPNIGTLREIFFLQHLSENHQIKQAKKGDFLVDNFTFEIGGKNKSTQQVKDVENAWIVKDNIEFSLSDAIPLWLFGFLY